MPPPPPPPPPTHTHHPTCNVSAQHLDGDPGVITGGGTIVLLNTQAPRRQRQQQPERQAGAGRGVITGGGATVLLNPQRAAPAGSSKERDTGRQVEAMGKCTGSRNHANPAGSPGRVTSQVPTSQVMHPTGVCWTVWLPYASSDHASSGGHVFNHAFAGQQVVSNTPQCDSSIHTGRSTNGNSTLLHKELNVQSSAVEPP